MNRNSTNRFASRWFLAGLTAAALGALLFTGGC